MTPLTPLLRFLDEERGSRPLHEVGWTGEWPPPGRFLVLVGRQSGIVRVIPDDEPYTQEVLDAMAHPSIDAMMFTRRSYSRLPEDDPEGRVVRAAVYARASDG